VIGGRLQFRLANSFVGHGSVFGARSPNQVQAPVRVVEQASASGTVTVTVVRDME
jgi:hypothetical protein